MTGSVFGKSSKGLLGVHVPLHSRHRMSPPVLHALPGTLVRLVTRCDHFFQMAVLGLYDLISRVPVEWGIARSTHLFACHCFHVRLRLLVRGSLASAASARRFLHEGADPCLVGGGQLRQSEGTRPHGAFIEVRLVAESERCVPRLELPRVLEEADDVAVPDRKSTRLNSSH